MSLAASICGPVPRAGGLNGLGLMGMTNAVAESVVYPCAESNRHIWPYMPPPRVDLTELVLALSSSRRIFRHSKHGLSCTRVSTLCWKYTSLTLGRRVHDKPCFECLKILLN